MASNPSRAHRWRRLRDAITLTGLALASVTALAATALPPGLVADIYVDRPTILVFVPAAPSDDDGDIALTRAQAAQALSLAGACLGHRPAMYQLVVADRIVLHDGARVADFDIGNTAPLTGVVLAAPRRNPRVLFAGGGPQSLAAATPLAAAEFFHQVCAL